MATQTAAKTLTLKYLKTIGIVNNQPTGRGFANPVDLKVSKDGRIFVLNRGAPSFARVGVCNLDEDYLYEFGSYGDEDGQFKLVTGMAFDSVERLYVADEELNRISIFDSSGKFISKWGTPGSGDGELNGATGIAIDADDNVYVVDQHSHRVQKFTPDGKFILKWGEFGRGNGQFNMPWGCTVDAQGYVYVADWRNNRIQKFDPDGQFVAKFGHAGEGNGEFRRPSGVAVDKDGNIYVADWGNERVQVLAPDGSFLLKLRGEATVSKWAEDFFAANQDEWRVRVESNLAPKRLPSHFKTPYLVASQVEPYFWGPVSVNLDREGRMYVTETARHRVQIYSRA
jgi:DNA-binding beta-propeller fold protein YncE